MDSTPRINREHQARTITVRRAMSLGESFSVVPPASVRPAVLKRAPRDELGAWERFAAWWAK